MATAIKYGDGKYSTDSEDEFKLIPIYFRLPDYSPMDLVTGYLEKKRYPMKQKRFYGYYNCKICDNRWRSGYSWQGYKEECKLCQLSKWPYEVYHLEKSEAKGYEKPHKSELCEKCQEDGVHCLTKLPLKADSEQAHPANLHASDDIEDENEFNIYFAKQFELERNFIEIEPQYIWDLFDSLWDILPREGKSDFEEALEGALQHWQEVERWDMVFVCEQVLDEIRYYYRYPKSKRKDFRKEFELIPIYFRLPDYTPVDLVTGYLEKKRYPMKRKKRFYGYYICETCHNRPIRTSGYSWQGYRQECKRCQELYWPYMVYHLEKSKAKGRKYEKPHKSELCEKCQEDGVHCLTKLPLKADSEQAHPANLHASDDIEDENEFNIYFAKQFELERNFIEIEPQYIWDLFDSLWDILPREGKADFKEALEGHFNTGGRQGEGIWCWFANKSKMKSDTITKSRLGLGLGIRLVTLITYFLYSMNHYCDKILHLHRQLYSLTSRKGF